MLPVGTIASALNFKGSDYTTLLTNLLVSMMTGSLLKGYDTVSISDTQVLKLGEIATYRLVETYDGEYFQGRKYLIMNLLDKPITLEPSEFQTAHSRALALSNQTLPPQGTGYLYEVV